MIQKPANLPFVEVFYLENLSNFSKCVNLCLRSKMGKIDHVLYCLYKFMPLEICMFYAFQQVGRALLGDLLAPFRLL